jgi:hypothetical protein
MDYSQPIYSSQDFSNFNSKDAQEIELSEGKGFNRIKFNKKFEEQTKIEQKINNKSLEDNEYNYEPFHKQKVEDIIIGIRDLFFIILNMIENKQNPIPFIFQSEQRKLYFSLFLIIFGGLLLLLSSLMKSPNNKL